MKKLLLLIFAILQFTTSNAQQFSFKMLFEDAVGNLDSLTLGYDPAATDSLDAAFGETNIISTPYTTGLDVRAGNEWFLQNSFGGNFGQTPFETKTQILPIMCGGNFWTTFPIAQINVVSNHFPISIYWNKTLFNDSCRNGSMLTGWAPLGWFDVGSGGFMTPLGSYDTSGVVPDQNFYVNGSDTVHVYWVTLADSTYFSAGINDLNFGKQLINLYPNPSSQSISLIVSKSFGVINNVQFYNQFGEMILSTKQLNNIDVAQLKGGLYFIKVTNSKGFTTIIKFQKI